MSGTSFTAATSGELSAALAAITDGTASYTVTLTADIALDIDLPAIALANGGTVSIDGDGHSLSGGLAHRGLFAFSGTTLLADLTFTGLAARGGDGGAGRGTTDSGSTGGGGGAGLGGALFVAGPNVVGGQTLTTGATVIASNVNFISNIAYGGNALSGFTNDPRVLGAGGGMGGAGASGNGGSYAAGGGGGLGSGATGAGATLYSGVGGPAGQGILPDADGGAAGAGGGLGASGANGGFGGGAAAGATGGGTGGFGGGGGGGGTGVGGIGGFGGGGGVGDGGGGLGGWGAGNGYRAPHATSSGGGGLAAGGAIFVQQGGQLVIAAGTIFGNYVDGGSAAFGSGPGGQYGGGLFMQGNNAVLLAPPPGTSLFITNSIADQSGVDPGGLRWHQPAAGVLSVSGGGTVALNGNGAGNNPFAGGITVNGATLRLGGQGAAGSGSITFTPVATDRLIVGGGTPANTVIGFAAEDTLAFPNVAPGAVAVTQSGTDTLIAGLKVRGSFSSGQLAITGDGNGGALVSLACFAAGTRILTEHGEVAVELLRVGDRVATRLGGRLAPIAWIGHRTLDCRRHPRPDSVHPIRISACAFGPRLPHRDLRLSPDHAVLVGADPPVLVPVHALVNGETVRQEPAGRITYFHVELARHDALLAEGLACESYLDTGNREAFANVPATATALHPDFAARRWDEAACAMLALDGPAVAAARARLLARAPARVADPAVRLDCDGAPMAAAAGGTLHLPHGAGVLRLRSRVRVPAWTEPASTDRRQLGVALRGLVADGLVIALDSPRLAAGWHAPEGGFRWTDGDGRLDVRGVRRLRLEFATIGEYWPGQEYSANNDQLSDHGYLFYREP